MSQITQNQKEIEILISRLAELTGIDQQTYLELLTNRHKKIKIVSRNMYGYVTDTKTISII